jgi:hypothetical protein
MKTVIHSGHTITAHGRFELDINCWTVTLYIKRDDEAAPNVIICTDPLFERDEEAESYGLEIGKKWVDERREIGSEKTGAGFKIGKSSHPSRSRWPSA